MRDILFRGKKINNKTWAYGYLSKARLLGYKGNTLQPCIDHEDDGVMQSSVVDPETVGQWTGLTDKNGKRIFEGDILHRSYNKNDVYIAYDDGRYVFNFCSIDNFEKCALLVCKQNLSGLKVIGNIHDNPELLKGDGYATL